jgi:hypothetical protein
MLLDGIPKSKQHLILFLFDTIMELPITKKELDFIIELVKHKNPELYNKLWTYRFNFKTGDKKDYGFS